MKGFKKDGKFRPTGNKTKSSLKKSDLQKRQKHSQPKCSECGRKMGMLQTDKCDTCQAKPKEEGKWKITETKYGRDKKTIEVNQTTGQKHRADKAVKEGTHEHVGFNALVKQIKSDNPTYSDKRARETAGSIQAKSKKKFGSKTVSKGGKKHVEPAI